MMGRIVGPHDEVVSLRWTEDEQTDGNDRIYYLAIDVDEESVEDEALWKDL
jgi:hypothetical protein